MQFGVGSRNLSSWPVKVLLEDPSLNQDLEVKGDDHAKAKWGEA